MKNKKEDPTAYALTLQKKAAKKLRAIQASQSFDGTLRVHPESVFVGRGDGKRALKILKKLSAAPLAKAS